MTRLRISPKCLQCGVEIPYSARYCIGCGVDVGVPNVRACETPEELVALRERVRDAQVSAKERGCFNELEAFGAEASNAQAVMAKHIGPLNAFTADENNPLVTYHKAVRSDSRIPEDNDYDRNRARIDGIVNPFNVHEDIQYAVLSLNGKGVQWYGDFFITFRESMISSRSSVFEENAFLFFDKYPIKPTGNVPPGHRAQWSRRGELAMAKLYPRIKVGMQSVEFADVLVEQGVDSPTSDFIEVHIYGPLHVRAIEGVVGKLPSSRADQIIWKRVSRRLEALGATVVLA